MSEEVDWAERFREADRYHEQRKEMLAKRRGAEGEFFTAALSAYQGLKEEELLPVRDEQGKLVWTAEQGFKAACYAREDAAAALGAQMFILKRLQGLMRLAWAVVALLTYVAYRLT